MIKTGQGAGVHRPEKLDCTSAVEAALYGAPQSMLDCKRMDFSLAFVLGAVPLS